MIPVKLVPWWLSFHHVNSRPCSSTPARYSVCLRRVVVQWWEALSPTPTRPLCVALPPFSVVCSSRLKSENSERAQALQNRTCQEEQKQGCVAQISVQIGRFHDSVGGTEEAGTTPPVKVD